MRFPRCSGVLLHPTSLPGPYGIGEIGGEARAFVDFLAGADQSLWQILPLGPTGFGDSPYQCFSSFGANPLLISLEDLVADGLLVRAELERRPNFPAGNVAYGDAIPWRRAMLEHAAERFGGGHDATLRAGFEAFHADNAGWLDDFTLFMALKDSHNGAPWYEWEEPLVRRDPGALAVARDLLADRVRTHALHQFLFFRQWSALRRHAHERGVRIIGDVPIFVAMDSADAWANPDLFFFDDARRPTVVAGVPPDYFSETGQRWGNPLYRWDAMARDGFAWWIARLRAQFAQCDIVRLDHFIGFTRYWEIPADEQTAVRGRWLPGPGAALFEAVERAFGKVPIIAEDLGVVTTEVEALRDRFEFPGMKIVPLAFEGDATHPFLPHNFARNCVAYTSTHDSGTARGWLDRADERARRTALAYLGSSPERFAHDLIRWVWASVADTAIVQAQDILGLGDDARMNFPGRPGGNWSWRLPPGTLDPNDAERLAEWTGLCGRSAMHAPATDSTAGD